MPPSASSSRSAAAARRAGTGTRRGAAAARWGRRCWRRVDLELRQPVRRRLRERAAPSAHVSIPSPVPVSGGHWSRGFTSASCARRARPRPPWPRPPKTARSAAASARSVARPKIRPCSVDTSRCSAESAGLRRRGGVGAVVVVLRRRGLSAAAARASSASSSSSSPACALLARRALAVGGPRRRRAAAADGPRGGSLSEFPASSSLSSVARRPPSSIARAKELGGGRAQAVAAAMPARLRRRVIKLGARDAPGRRPRGGERQLGLAGACAATAGEELRQCRRGARSCLRTL